MFTNAFTTCRDKVAQLLSKPFFHDYRTILVMWIVMCLILAITKSYNSDGNYRIFIGVWYHTIEQLPLFDHYPLEYDDMKFDTAPPGHAATRIRPIATMGGM